MKQTYRVIVACFALGTVLCATALMIGCQESAPGASTNRIRPVGAKQALPEAAGQPERAPDAGSGQDTADPPPEKVAAWPPGTLDISFDDVKFEMEKEAPFERGMLTEKIEALASRKIRIRGYILPGFKNRGLTSFVLVRDNQECCFGPGAALYDCVMVRMAPGKTTSFSIRPVTVEGEFAIKEWKDFDNVTRAIYHLSGQSVQ